MARLIFDFPAPDGTTTRTTFGDPMRVLVADRVEEVVPVLRQVQDAVDTGSYAAGYLAYEAARAFEPRMRVRGGTRMPLAWFGLFDAPAPDSGQSPAARIVTPGKADPEWQLDLPPASHAAVVDAIRDAIAEGRTYQVNHTARFRTVFEDDPLALYDRLSRAQGAGWHAYLDIGRFAIASASPELFFRVRRGADGAHVIETRPMKGTRPRGRWTEEDEGLAAELAASPKERAENLMIVDLLRNDLGRVARTGSVDVPRLLEVERYRTVWQMTSTVTAELRDDVGVVDLFRALFPCGSVTGAPKISTMGIIADLETSPREVYCGAIGWIRPGGECAFSVPIRTAWVDRDAGEAVYGAGGGVLWDSRPDAEYDELLAKAALLRERWPVFGLVETLRLEDGTFLRLDRHLARLRASAEYFGVPLEGGELAAILTRTASLRPLGRFRCRLMLGDDGRIDELTEPLDWKGGDGPDDPAALPGKGPVPVALAESPVSSSDRFLFHKTTHRAAFHRRVATAPPAFDLILRNERGELTELMRGNLVIELDGALLTPPRDAGLLAGCLRGEAIAAGVVSEATLRPLDLIRATRLWFINSTRGWLRIRIGTDQDWA